MEIPAFIFLGFWFLMQTLESTLAFSSQAAASSKIWAELHFLAHASGLFLASSWVHSLVTSARDLSNIVPRGTIMPKCLVIANQKGGVAKNNNRR